MIAYVFVCVWTRRIRRNDNSASPVQDSIASTLFWSLFQKGLLLTTIALYATHLWLMLVVILQWRWLPLLQRAGAHPIIRDSCGMRLRKIFP
jgi:hypothetical protein